MAAQGDGCAAHLRDGDGLARRFSSVMRSPFNQLGEARIPPPCGEGGARSATGGGLAESSQSCGDPHPTRLRRATLPARGRDSRPCSVCGKPATLAFPHYANPRKQVWVCLECLEF